MTNDKVLSYSSLLRLNENKFKIS